MAAMAKFSIKSFALKWYYFSCPGSTSLYCEYFNLFMKQLGFNPAQIGLTSLLGVFNLFIPLCLLFGEKFRARKTVAVFGTVAVLICYTLPLSALVVPPLQPTCYSKTSNDSVEAKQQATLRNGPVHSKYANNPNNISASKTSTYTMSSTPIFRSKVTMPSEQSQLTNDSIHSRYSSDTKQPSASKIHYLLPYLTTNSSLSVEHSMLSNSSSHSNYSKNPTQSSKIHPQHLLNALFFILLLSRSLTVFLDSINLSLANLATVTYLKEENASYGAYLMWSNVGTGLSVFCVAVLAWFIRISICGVEKYGYFIAFIWGGVMSLLSILSLPWFTFEYNEKKSFNWSGVKSDVFNAHYIFMFLLLFFTGLCMSFQSYWEFWYLDGLSASPLLLAGAVLIRRSLIALSTLASTHLIRKIGDLKTVCVALFLYASSFLALSFARIAWLVLVIDTFQAAALGIGYCAFTVLFYKASSKENSSMILGIEQTVFAIGFDAGSTLMGVLFHALGTRLTLLIYSVSSAALLVTLLVYIRFSKYVHEYEKLPQDSDIPE